MSYPVRMFFRVLKVSSGSEVVLLRIWAYSDLPKWFVAASKVGAHDMTMAYVSKSVAMMLVRYGSGNH